MEKSKNVAWSGSLCRAGKLNPGTSALLHTIWKRGSQWRWECVEITLVEESRVKGKYFGEDRDWQ